MIAEQYRVENFEEQLSNLYGPPIIMDGGVGSEFRDRGQAHGIKLVKGLWSATALLSESGQDLLYEIHRDFFIAGADIAIANTFRTQRETFIRAGRKDQSLQTTKDAVAIAIQARDEAKPDAIVAFSAAPLNDCYRPIAGLFSTADLEKGQYRHAKIATEAGAELVVCETLPSIAEAEAALKSAKLVGLRAIVSFYCTGDGTKLPSGESFEKAAYVAQEMGAIAVGNNCVTPLKASRGLEILTASEYIDLPLCTYMQAYEKDNSEVDIGISASQYPVHLLREIQKCIDARSQVRIIGGCCNVTPEDIGLLVNLAKRQKVEQL